MFNDLLTRKLSQVTFNEAETLPRVLADIPESLPGIDVIETLIIDDGSTDGTTEVARRLGVTHIVENTGNIGLARSFQRGLNASLAAGADIIVNTDGDHQYSGGSIGDLIAPVVDGRADVVVGDRQTAKSEEFSALKRSLQGLGSSVVRRLSGLDIADAVSGFRAYSRQAAMGTNVLSTFSYTTETLIQAGRRGLIVTSVPVETNPSTRPSRLMRSLAGFILKQVITILRAYVMYRPLRVFGTLAVIMIAIGLVPILRFLYFYAIGQGDGHVQSLILGTMFFSLGYLTFVVALLSDVTASNRLLLESALERVRRIELGDTDTE
ncbi:MAG: glycosyltransferase family 2 protein [Pseudomonadota bacterium]